MENVVKLANGQSIKTPIYLPTYLHSWPTFSLPRCRSLLCRPRDLNPARSLQKNIYTTRHHSASQSHSLVLGTKTWRCISLNWSVISLCECVCCSLDGIVLQFWSYFLILLSTGLRRKCHRIRRPDEQLQSSEKHNFLPEDIQLNT